jgi:hypothetical protein
VKNSNDTIGNQTRNLPDCSTVPQPTVPPRALDIKYGKMNCSGKMHLNFPADAGSVCDRAPVTADVLRGKIKDTLRYKVGNAFM